MSQTENTSSKDPGPIPNSEPTSSKSHLASLSPEKKTETLFQLDSPDFRPLTLRVPKAIRKKSQSAKKSKQRQQPHVGIDSLPAELKLEILSQFNSPADVRSLRLASSSYNAVFGLNSTRILKAVQRNRFHPDTLAVCQELSAHGVHGVRDLLNPGPFPSFDVIVMESSYANYDRSDLACAVRSLFVQARSGERIDLCAEDRKALREIVAVTASRKVETDCCRVHYHSGSLAPRN